MNRRTGGFSLGDVTRTNWSLRSITFLVGFLSVVPITFLSTNNAYVSFFFISCTESLLNDGGLRPSETKLESI